jgi:hypothetical protein
LVPLRGELCLYISELQYKLPNSAHTTGGTAPVANEPCYPHIPNEQIVPTDSDKQGQEANILVGSADVLTMA